MGLFQALLLAASLGWTAVLADPSDSANASSPATSTWTSHHATFNTLSPILASSADHLSIPGYPTSVPGSMTMNSPVTMLTASSLHSPPTYASPVSMITRTSLDSPGKPTSKVRMPVTQPTAPGLDVPGNQISRHGGGGSPTGGRGSPSNEGSGPTSRAAAETYDVHGSAVVAGASPTVIAGTTYSIAKSGGRIWVDGTATSVQGIVNTPAPLGSASGSGTFTPVAATGAAGRIIPPDIAIGAAFGLIALL